MSNTGDFGPDGTQPPPPPLVYPDPAAGLGGSRATGFRATRADRPKLEIAQPVEPDPEVAREAMRAAFGEDLPAAKRKQQPTSRARPSGQRAPARQVQRQAGGRTQEPTVATGLGQARRRQSIGCAVVLVIVLIIVLLNVFSGLGAWLDTVFHP